MLNGLVGGYYPLLALYVASMLLTTFDPTSHGHRMAYAACSDVEAMERSQRKAQTVCILAETGRRDVLNVQPSCSRR
ncbi:MAG TPA: hypothetical protein VFG62_24175 [Rhodopila sp.]|nr:hypothetical protein [Rhodopila sp.]